MRGPGSGSRRGAGRIHFHGCGPEVGPDELGVFGLGPGRCPELFILSIDCFCFEAERVFEDTA